MNILFLQEAALNAGDAAIGGGIVAALMVMFAVMMLIMVVLYIYLGFVYMAIGKKAKYPLYGLAWIPGIGPLIVTNRIADMHWWPILLLAGFWIPIVGQLLMLALAVFSTIWLWKTFEAVDRPGWWALLCLIPIVNLVMLGIAAWGGKK